ncbi:MAG: VWA domain-containing protein [Candidatus Aegiribacteria sp.]|nr:VWA domain-containing protein [Candidatus Aegiribacteria sp.]
MSFQFLPALLAFPVFLTLTFLLSRKRKVTSQTYSGPFSFQSVSGSPGSGTAVLLQWTGIALLCIALARPQQGFERLPEAGEGLDIIITLDVSGSMDQTDYYPSRLAAAKKAALTFIDGRPNDRIGLVIYADQPRTLCPPTFDHAILERFIQNAELGTLPDGTSIGAGLAVAAKGFNYSQTSRRVVVLISDGEDTSSQVDPITVARAINTIHGDSLRVYTVAIGKPLSENGLGLDIETLSYIAELNGGRLFNVESPEQLDEVYSSIDSLEASTLPAEGLFVYRDSYMFFLISGMILMLISNVMKYRFFKVVGD